MLLNLLFLNSGKNRKIYKQIIFDTIVMTYVSLFDRLKHETPEGKFGGSNCFDNAYDGTLDQVLEELEESIRRPVKSTSDLLRLALHPPRIIRAVVDIKILAYELVAYGMPNIETNGIEGLLREAIDLSLDIYQNPEAGTKRIDDFRKRIEEVGLPHLLSVRLEQKSDFATWNATQPSKSKSSAYRLLYTPLRKDVLFIALAHGGVAAGMDVYLRYCEISGSDNSEFYVVRFSKHKLDDQTPRLTQTEIEYLQGLSKDRYVVIFDEDSVSGKTLSQAESWFYRNVFPGKAIMALANYEGLPLPKEIIKTQPLYPTIILKHPLIYPARNNKNFFIPKEPEILEFYAKA